MERLAARASRGQSMTEYIVIIALVAVGTIGVVGLFGNNIRALFGGSSDAIAGSTSVANGGRVATPGMETKNLRTFAMGGSGSLKNETSVSR